MREGNLILCIIEWRVRWNVAIPYKDRDVIFDSYYSENDMFLDMFSELCI